MRLLAPTLTLLLVGVVLSIPASAGDSKTDFPRERGKNTDAQKDALEGKTPPALSATTWQNTNGKPLTWDSLRGKVVVIDFWGTW